MTMHPLRTLVLLVITASALLAAERPGAAVVAKTREGSFDLITSVRTNGCRLELRRYAKSKPYLQGYWIDDVYVGDKQLVRIHHSATEKEQSLAIEQNTGYGILQIDRDLDGKYEMLIVVSVKDQRLIDVLFVTDDGWLRHSTPEEFEARLRIAEGNRRATEEVDKTITDALKKAKEDLKK